MTSVALDLDATAVLVPGQGFGDEAILALSARPSSLGSLQIDGCVG